MSNLNFKERALSFLLFLNATTRICAMRWLDRMDQQDVPTLVFSSPKKFFPMHCLLLTSRKLCDSFFVRHTTGSNLFREIAKHSVLKYISTAMTFAWITMMMTNTTRKTMLFLFCKVKRWLSRKAVKMRKWFLHAHLHWTVFLLLYVFVEDERRFLHWTNHEKQE